MLRIIRTALAAPQTLAGDIVQKCDTAQGCTPDDLVLIGVRATQIMFGFVGSVVLFFFVYGGVVYLTAAGSKERVAKGTQIIRNAAIGLFVVFLSYTIVGFVFRAFAVPGWENFATTGWFPKSQ